jgi:MFS transporter, DHA2 family, methylenomycin A resistance protein
VNVALERIKASLDTDISGLQWVVNASYTLVFASLLLTAGALVDRLGAKRVFLAGFALFTAASLACGLADQIAVLVACRVGAGRRSGAVRPGVPCTSERQLPGTGRPRAGRQHLGRRWGPRTRRRPCRGGHHGRPPRLAEHLLPQPAVRRSGLWLTLLYAPQGSRTPDRGLDLVGQVLAILALGGLTLGFIESGSLGWMHPLVQAGFGSFAVGTVAFLLTEARSADPMLPLSLFRSSAVNTSCIVGLLTNFAYYRPMFVLSLFFQAEKGFSPLATGLAFLPMTALATVASLVAGWLTAHFGPRLPMAIGQAVAAAAYLALSGINATTPYGNIVGPLLAAGIGVALTVPSRTAAVLANTDKRRAGIASGALNAARQTGGVIGVGAFGSLVSGDSTSLVGGMHVALIIAGLALVVGCLVSAIGLRY